MAPLSWCSLTLHSECLLFLTPASFNPLKLPLWRTKPSKREHCIGMITSEWSAPCIFYAPTLMKSGSEIKLIIIKQKHLRLIYNHNNHLIEVAIPFHCVPFLQTDASLLHRNTNTCIISQRNMPLFYTKCINNAICFG